MKVGFDITPHYANRMTGAGRVVAGYARALSRVPDGPELVLIGFKENFVGLDDLPPQRVERRLLKREQLLGPAAEEVGRWRGVRRFGARDRIDLYHANLELTLPGHGIPVVYHLYDLARLDPQVRHSNRSLRARIRTRLRYGLAERSDLIVTISQASRDDIARRLQIDPTRIRVIHPGVEERFFEIPRKRQALVLRRYGLSAGYVLFVGQLGRQKNESVLLEAWERTSSRFPDTKLVFAGDSSNALPGFGLRAARLDTEILGRVADEDLPSLIAGAGVLVLISTNEGFGLPVAEALAAGTPVIVGNRGALPEVAGDAGLIVDSDDVQGLSNALTELLTGPECAARLSELALRRGREFRWERAAAQMIELYRELLQSKAKTR
ncbi:MAG: glycosyltransferase family 1 protein [Candidatus Alcyoniella australis]|nr:glycosyltransferase family 1 protein [Candidatus Alcyoniella australis]